MKAAFLHVRGIFRHDEELRLSSLKCFACYSVAACAGILKPRNMRSEICEYHEHRAENRQQCKPRKLRAFDV